MASVYFLRQKKLSPVKIGYSKDKNPTRRINSYNSYFPNGVDFIGFVEFENIDDALCFEKTTYEYFSLLKIKGEWFEISENKIITYLEQKNKYLIKIYKDEKINIEKEIYDLFIKYKDVKKISELKNLSIQYVYRKLKKINKIKENAKEKSIIENYLLLKNVKKVAVNNDISIQYVYRILKKNHIK